MIAAEAAPVFGPEDSSRKEARGATTLISGRLSRRDDVATAASDRYETEKNAFEMRLRKGGCTAPPVYPRDGT
jgi:hypothetical protein